MASFLSPLCAGTLNQFLATFKKFQRWHENNKIIKVLKVLKDIVAVLADIYVTAQFYISGPKWAAGICTVSVIYSVQSTIAGILQLLKIPHLTKKIEDFLEAIESCEFDSNSDLGKALNDTARTLAASLWIVDTFASAFPFTFVRAASAYQNTNWIDYVSLILDIYPMVLAICLSFAMGVIFLKIGYLSVKWDKTWGKMIYFALFALVYFFESLMAALVSGLLFISFKAPVSIGPRLQLALWVALGFFSYMLLGATNTMIFASLGCMKTLNKEQLVELKKTLDREQRNQAQNKPDATKAGETSPTVAAPVAAGV